VFDRFRTEGRRVRHGPLWCSWIDDQAAVPPRVAYAVGRPVGTAVARNRLRRRLRAAVSSCDATRPLPAGWYLLGAASPASELSSSELQTAVAALLHALAHHRR
jgi:ribonuclease P protein component